MDQEKSIMQTKMTTPRAAAIAGILFLILLIASLSPVRISVPADPQDAGEWLSDNGKAVSLALNLVPFAGIAFLWFIGVERDRLGTNDDRFFATVFLRSGFLFLCYAVHLHGNSRWNHQPLWYCSRNAHQFRRIRASVAQKPTRL